MTAGTPALVSVNPDAGQQGQQNLSVALTGQFTNWVQGMTTASFGAGITVASLTVNSPTSHRRARHQCGSRYGPRTVTLTTGSENDTLSNGFTVNAGTPVFLSVSPSAGRQGQQNLSATLTGQFTKWVQGTNNASFGAGITVAFLTVNSPTSATAVLGISAAGAIGPRTVTLTTGTEVDTLTNGFTVTAGAPVFVSVTPMPVNRASKISLSRSRVSSRTGWRGPLPPALAWGSPLPL